MRPPSVRSTAAWSAMLLAILACDNGGQGDGPAIADPADPVSFVYPDAFLVRAGIPWTTPDLALRPRFEVVEGPIGTATVTAGTQLQWTFNIPNDSPGRVEAVLVRVGDLIEHAEFRRTLTDAATTTSYSISESVGVGTFELAFFIKARNTAMGMPRVLVSDPVSTRITVRADEDEGSTIPSSYDSGFASCAVEDSPMTRFANDVTTGRCFFIVDGFREDCDRCDDVGVDACARRLCTP